MSDLTKGIRSIYTSYSEREQKLIKYSLLFIGGEASKLLILFTVFRLLNLLVPFCITFAVLSSFRFTSGGLHLNHYWSCLVFTFCSYITICYILPTYVSLPRTILLVLAVLGVIVIMWLAPIPSDKRPKPSPKRMKIYKYISIALAFVWLMAAFKIQKSMTANLIEYTIVFQALQMLFAYMKSRNRSAKQTVTKESIQKGGRSL